MSADGCSIRPCPALQGWFTDEDPPQEQRAGGLPGGCAGAGEGVARGAWGRADEEKAREGAPPAPGSPLSLVLGGTEGGAWLHLSRGHWGVQCACPALGRIPAVGFCHW